MAVELFRIAGDSRAHFAACRRVDRNIQLLIGTNKEHKAVEHFFDSLKAVANSASRVRVERIEAEIVKMSDRLDCRPCGKFFFPWLQFISKLPLEIVVGNSKQRLAKLHEVSCHFFWFQ